MEIENAMTQLDLQITSEYLCGDKVSLADIVIGCEVSLFDHLLDTPKL